MPNLPWIARTGLKWRTFRPRDKESLQAFLKTYEVFTNNLATRLFGRSEKGIDRTWLLYLFENEGRIEGVLGIHKYGFAGIHVQKNESTDFPDTLTFEELRELGAIVGSGFSKIRTLMGSTPLIHQILTLIPKSFDFRVEYSMLYRPLETLLLSTTTDDLVCRNSTIYDEESLLPLQLRYEQEEVVLPGHPINPEGTRRFLVHSLAHQIAVHGEYKGQIVTKAMTNARGSLVDQIGGVYTEPGYRGRGFARRIMIELLKLIEADRKSASLFVKRSNTPALRLYDNLGFFPVGGFSIVYFS